MYDAVLINAPLSEDIMKAKYKALAPPLGLLSIAAVLLQNGINVEFIDGDKEDGIDSIMQKVKDCNPKYIGISTTTMSFKNAVKLAEALKNTHKDATVIMGGQHATYYAEKIMIKYVFIDAICQGEGEYTFLELVQGKALSVIKGLVYRENGEIKFNEQREMIEDLDQLPLPARQLADKYSYDIKFGFFDLRRHCYGRMFNYVSIITSRGCPGGCYFCSGTQYNGMRIRFRSAESVIRELDMLINKGCDTFFITDDNFTASPARVKKICEYLKEQRKLKDISWFCFGRVDTASEELFKTMKEAGCYFILFGIEHISKEVRDYYHKNTTNEKIKNAIRIARKSGIGIYASVIVGAPVESLEEFDKCVKFFKKSRVDILEVHRLMIFPGSNLWRDMNEKFPQKISALWEQPISYTDIADSPTHEETCRRQKVLTRAFFVRFGFVFDIIVKIFSIKIENLLKRLKSESQGSANR